METLPGTRRAVKQLVEDWDDDVVLNHAKQLRELVDHPGWGTVQLIIQRAKAIEERLIVADPGGLPSRAQYASRAGAIAGLAIAAEAPQALIELAERIIETRERAGSDQEPQTAAGGR